MKIWLTVAEGAEYAGVSLVTIRESSFIQHERCRRLGSWDREASNAAVGERW
jgi:hypothetical protein